MWSMRCLATGVVSTTDPWGNPLQISRSRCKPGEVLPIKAAFIEVKGDWAHFADVLGLPRWNGNGIICFRCTCTLEELPEVGPEAAWRDPGRRFQGNDLLGHLYQEGKTPSTLWSLPLFQPQMLRFDWLHCADQGVTATWLGAVLEWLVHQKDLGRNMEERIQRVWADILNFYEETKCTDRLKKLTLNQFRKKEGQPCLKGGAAQIRNLIPWLVAVVQGWNDADCSGEQLAIKDGSIALGECYKCLSKADDAPPPSHLKEQGIKFARMVVELHQQNPAIYSCKPKLHQWLELTMEGSQPSLSWNYREEDFGGSLGGYGHRTGGWDTAPGCSKRVLEHFMMHHDVPRLL